MKKIAIIGGNKKFNAQLLKILKDTDIQWKVFTKYMVKRESYYDYVVLNSNSSIKDIFIRGAYCFVNMDLINDQNSANIYGYIITYGLGSKNTVTVSSMEDNNSFVYCLQRDVNYNVLDMLEPEEIPINMDFKSEEDIYAAMVGITMILIERKEISNLTKEKKLAILK